MRNIRTRLLALGTALALTLGMAGAALADSATRHLTILSPQQGEVLYWGETVPVKAVLQHDDPDFDYDAITGVNALIEDFCFLAPCDSADGVYQTRFTVPKALESHSLFLHLMVTRHGVNGDYQTIAETPGVRFSARPLPQPVAPKAKAGARGVTVTFTKSAADDGRIRYEIWRSAKENSGFRRLTTTTNPSYTDTAVRDGVRYYYKLRAVRNVYGSITGDFTKTLTATVPARTPKTPARVRAAAGKRKVTVTWRKSSLATKYQVWRSVKKGRGYKLVKTTKALRFTDKGVKKGGRYYYRVKAVRVTPTGTKLSSVSAPARSGRVR